MKRMLRLGSGLHNNAAFFSALGFVTLYFRACSVEKALANKESARGFSLINTFLFYQQKFL